MARHYAPAMRPDSILEAVLYARDLDAAASFYTDVLGLTLVSDRRPLSIALRIGPGAVLLIFNPDQSAQPGRGVPSHGSTGAGHIAFTIAPKACDDWRVMLGEAGVVIEREITWERRAADASGHPHRSIYLRDPEGNSVELITGDIWPMVSGSAASS